MISFLSWRSGLQLVAVVVSVMAFLSACSPARQGYFLPQTNSVTRLTISSDERITLADTTPTRNKETDSAVSELPAIAANEFGSGPVPAKSSTAFPAKSLPYQHRNPESRSIKRFGRLFNPLPVAHVAPKRQTVIDRHNPARKIHRLALVALGISVLAYTPLLLVGGSTLVWVLSFTLPLAAVMLGVSSLATINRNKDRFRGKGWAMAAVMMGTGVLGLALVALAALSMSKVVWEK